MAAPAQSETKYIDHDILRSIQGIDVKARLLVEGMYASRHRSPYYGHTVEFKDYREYVPGDAPKMIDWKILGRTERYVVKRFEMESNMNVVCLLDASGSMGYQPSDSKRLTKLEYGSYLVASLCYLIIKQQDAAGMVTFDTDMREFLPPRQGQRHLFGLLSRLENIEPQAETDLETTLKKLAIRLTRRSIVVIISDCHGDTPGVVDGIKHVAARGHEVITFHLMDQDEVEFPFSDLTSFSDIETGVQLMCDPLRQKKRYFERLEVFQNAMRTGCLACGADYRFIHTGDPLEIVLRDYLLYRLSKG